MSLLAALALKVYFCSFFALSIFKISVLHVMMSSSFEDSIADPAYHRQHEDRAKSIAMDTTIFAKDAMHTNLLMRAQQHEQTFKV